jgi:hypothetical protein
VQLNPSENATIEPDDIDRGAEAQVVSRTISIRRSVPVAQVQS